MTEENMTFKITPNSESPVLEPAPTCADKDCNATTFCGLDRCIIHIRKEQKLFIGLMPRLMHNQLRWESVREALYYNITNEHSIPVKWVEEYNELLMEIEEEED